MFHGLPPFAAVLFATSDPRSVVLLPSDIPPVMPPPTQSAWFCAIVECVMVATVLALMRMAPPSPELPLFGGMPFARFPVNVLFVIAVGVACSSHSAPPWPRVLFPLNVLRAIVSEPFWW